MKTTTGYYFTPTIMALIFFFNKHDKYWQGCGEIGASVSCRWDVKDTATVETARQHLGG